MYASEDVHLPTYLLERMLGRSLPRLVGPPPSCEQLRQVLASCQLNRALLSRLVVHRPDTYVRRVLARSPEWEWVLLSWLPGQASKVHDHAHSRGAVRVVYGELTEVRFGWQHGRLVPQEARPARAPDILLEEPGTIHRVMSSGAGPAATLHLYAPPLTRMKQYPTAPVRAPRPEGELQDQRM